MNPSNKNHSEKVEKDKSADEILAEMDICNQRIRENVRKILESITEIGTEASKINFILAELRKLSQES